MEIRRPRPEDAAAVAAISAHWYPDRPEDTGAWRRAAEGEVSLSRYYVADDGEAVIGYGCLRPELAGHPDSGVFRLHLGVRPDRQRAGTGGRLYATLAEDLAPLGARAARVRVRDDRPAAVTFFRRRGFAPYQRMLRLVLDVAAHSPGPAAPPAGVVLTTLAAELQRRPDCLTTVHALRNTCYADVPTADPFHPPTWEDFMRELPDWLPDAFFLAREGEAYVGLSYLARDPADPFRLQQRFTGVLPAFRGRGIATALKVLTVRYAREGGYRAITTSTLSVNGPMRAVNRALGFQAEFTEVRLQRLLEAQ